MFIRAWVCIQWNMYRKYVWLIFFWDSSFHTHLRNFLNWMTVWYQPCRRFIAFWTCAINSIPDICIKEIRVLPVYISPLLHFHFPEDTNMVCLPEFIVRAIMQQAKIYGVLLQGWHKSQCLHHPWVELGHGWFSPLLEGVFLRVLPFSSLLKNQPF